MAEKVDYAALKKGGFMRQNKKVVSHFDWQWSEEI